MERSFECPVCFEQFSSSTKPLLIPCGHTACESCIQSLIRLKALECPVCRSLHHNLLTSSLSTNFALIHSESSKPSMTLLDRLQDLHSQQSTLSSQKDQLLTNYQKSESLLLQFKSEIQQKQDFLINFITTVSKSLASQVESMQAQIRLTYEKTFAILEQNLLVRADLISTLESFYSKNEEISPASRLQLASLTFPVIDTSFPRFLYKSLSVDFNEKVLNYFGTVEEEKVVKSSESMVMDLDIGKKSEKIEKIEKHEQGRGRGRGRMDVEQLKQPRQPKLEPNFWSVKNRFGKWEKLPVWFDLQIKSAAENNQESFNITNPAGKVEYLVNLREKISYRLQKSGQPGRGNQIALG